jgi:hypothetical protein
MKVKRDRISSRQETERRKSHLYAYLMKGMVHLTAKIASYDPTINKKYKYTDEPVSHDGQSKRQI